MTRIEQAKEPGKRARATSALTRVDIGREK